MRRKNESVVENPTTVSKKQAKKEMMLSGRFEA
jgi:hypothetical protein